MNKLFSTISQSIGISSIITTGFLYFFASKYTAEELVIIFALWLGFGAVVGIVTYVTGEIENIIKARVIHFLGVFLAFDFCIYQTIPGVTLAIQLTALLEFLLIYAIIFLVFYFIHKSYITKANSTIGK